MLIIKSNGRTNNTKRIREKEKKKRREAEEDGVEPYPINSKSKEQHVLLCGIPAIGHVQELDIAAESIYVDKQIRLVRQCNNVGGSGRVEGIGEDIVLPHPYAVSVLTQSIVPRLETFWVFVISRKNQLKMGRRKI